MTGIATRTEHNRVARHLAAGQLGGVSWLFAAFAAVLVVFGIVFELFFEVTGSIWAGALQIPRWFALGLGVYLTAVYLPVYVAHGRTRREVASGSAVFAVGLAALLGLAAVAGFAIEAGIYHLVGWTDHLPEPHPLGSMGQAATTYAIQTAVFLVWATVGALAGAAFYRSPVIGLAVVPVGLAMIAATTFFTGQDTGPFSLPQSLSDAAPETVLGVAACLTSALLAMALTWPIVRDIPLRSRSN